MPKKPLITSWERTQIAVAYNQHRQEKAQFIRYVASQLCGRELGLSTVQRELARLRKEHPRGSTDPLDDQWSLASLREYPVEYKDIPFLLYIQSTFDANVPDEVKESAQKKGRSMPFLTNRLAVWISRLVRLLHTDPRANNDNEIWTTPRSASENYYQWPDWVDDLISIAMWYSNYEIGCELTGTKPINTINFDAPTLQQIKSNILMRNKVILESRGIRNEDEEGALEILQSMKLDDVVPRGGKHARSYNKKG